MDKDIRGLLLYFVVLVVLFLVSCTEDDLKSQLPIDNIGQFEPEVFGDLTTAELEQIETPFEGALQSAIGGRVAVDATADLLIAELLKILEGAKILEIKDDEERGLQVYEIEILLASGAKLEIVIAKEIYKILEIEGQRGPFDYDIDPGGSFVSLKEAFDLAIAQLGGEVIRWELELEENNEWEFEIIIKTDAGTFEVEIDAFTGMVIEINEVDVEDEDEFEEEDETAPENIIEAVAGFITGEIVHADKKEEHDLFYWEIHVLTESGAVVFLSIKEETEDLVYAADEEGPYDYELTPDLSMISLQSAIDLALTDFEVEGEVYYWYFEQLWEKDQVEWAYFIKIKGEQLYAKYGIDAVSGDIFSKEIID